jgi:hypothetical protein
MTTARKPKVRNAKQLYVVLSNGTVLGPFVDFEIHPGSLRVERPYFRYFKKYSPHKSGWDYVLVWHDIPLDQGKIIYFGHVMEWTLNLKMSDFTSLRYEPEAFVGEPSWIGTKNKFWVPFDYELYAGYKMYCTENRSSLLREWGCST